MRKLLGFIALTLGLAACGGDAGHTASAPAPAARAPQGVDLSGYSEGVRRYYEGGVAHPDGDAEAEYNQPPKPAQAGLGQPISLTGSNIGVRLRVTPTAIEPLRIGGRRYLAVRLRLVNTGITVYEGQLRQAAITYGDGSRRQVVAGERGTCAGTARIDVSRSARGCLLFPGGRAERLQLALESVPVDAGGIWRLDSGT